MPTIVQHRSLQTLNTLALPANAHYYSRLEREQDLPALLTFAVEKNLDVVPLAGGSNVVLAGDIAGLLIHIALRGIDVKTQGDDVWVTAAAGENWHALVKYCVDAGYFGLENLALIPGSVGAAPIQNIGAYGVELAQVFHSLRGWDRERSEVVTLTAADCDFGYRDSVFKHALKDRFIITEVTLRLHRQPSVATHYPSLQAYLAKHNIAKPSPKQVMDAVIAIRRSKLPDPTQLPNAGSFFQNPYVTTPHYQQLRHTFSDIVAYSEADGRVKLAAGWLLEKAGWKGRRIGHLGMHQQQALVLIHYGGGNGAEVLKLAEKIKRDIADRFAVDLVIEPQVIGLVKF